MTENDKTSGPDGPSPETHYPVAGQKRVGFLKPLINSENIEIGDYTYYDDPDGPEHFVSKCVHYHYPFIGDRLIIGRFCAIASGVRFFMNGANHATGGFSTYPFTIFGQGWENPNIDWGSETRGDTVIGNDVWIGNGATILPGVTVGDGAIIGASAVVASDVPPYGVVAGNPARIAKMRFDENTVVRLCRIAWWHWEAAKITRNIAAIGGQDIDALEAAL